MGSVDVDDTQISLGETFQNYPLGLIVEKSAVGVDEVANGRPYQHAYTTTSGPRIGRGVDVSWSSFVGEISSLFPNVGAE